MANCVVPGRCGLRRDAPRTSWTGPRPGAVKESIRNRLGRGTHRAVARRRRGRRIPAETRDSMADVDPRTMVAHQRHGPDPPHPHRQISSSSKGHYMTVKTSDGHRTRYAVSLNTPDRYTGRCAVLRRGERRRGHFTTANLSAGTIGRRTGQRRCLPGTRLERAAARWTYAHRAPQLNITSVIAPSGGRVYVDHAHPNTRRRKPPTRSKRWSDRPRRRPHRTGRHRTPPANRLALPFAHHHPTMDGWEGSCWGRTRTI